MATRVDLPRPSRGVVVPLRAVKPARRVPAPPPITPGIPNAVLGTLIFLGAETMLFAGLVSAYLVLRAGSSAWPPLGQPRLPVVVTAFNTLILLGSGVTMRRAVEAARAGTSEIVRWLKLTAALGAIFLAIQGSEWIRLVHFGLGLSSGLYAATFYALIGCHGVHVLAGVLVLLAVLRAALRGKYTAREHGGLEASSVYWYFVVGVWPVLYVMVYLL